jgi:hypothetical protein
MPELIQPERIEQVILLIRGQRVMRDRDLAALYGVGVAAGRFASRPQPAFRRTLQEGLKQLGTDFHVLSKYSLMLAIPTRLTKSMNEAVLPRLVQAERLEAGGLGIV